MTKFCSVFSLFSNNAEHLAKFFRKQCSHQRIEFIRGWHGDNGRAADAPQKNLQYIYLKTGLLMD